MLTLHVLATGYVLTLKILFNNSITANLVSLFVSASYLAIMLLVISSILFNWEFKHLKSLWYILIILAEIVVPGICYVLSLQYIIGAAFIISDLLLSCEFFYFIKDRTIKIGKSNEINAAWIGASATIIAAVIGLIK